MKTLLTVAALLLVACRGQEVAEWRHTTAVELDEVFGRSTACATECADPALFQYQRSMVHVYDYHASAKFLGGSHQPQLGVTARVHVTVAGPCEMIMSLSHVRLTDSTASSHDFAAALTHNPLRFGFQDGRVSSVCPPVDELIWVLNFKRAVLSTFQNTMGTFSTAKTVTVNEIDVSGVCTSSYSSIQPETGLFNVTRKRSYTCKPPPAPKTAYLTTLLLQMMPFINTEQKCIQTISGGILKEAICRENIRYPELLRSKEEDPLASITSGLKMVYQFKADFVVVPNYEATRSSLAMEWEDRANDKPPSEWMASVTQMLQYLQENAPAPSIFYRLTEILRTLDYNQISEMFIGIAPELWPIASMATTSRSSEPSMKLFLNFIKHNAMSRGNMVKTATYLMKYFKVTSPMIDIMKEVLSSSLIDDDLVIRKLNGYCKANSMCKEDRRINDMFDVMHKRISSPECNYTDTSTDPENDTFDREERFKKNVRILNALRDVGSWPPSDTLRHCVWSTRPEEQYAAVEALRHAPCDVYDYNDLLDVARNITEDPYMRIMFYRTLVRCPTDEFKSYLAERFTFENVNQVTSFMWTHLLNVDKVKWVEQIIKDSTLIYKFSESKLKFSRNFKKEVQFLNQTFTIELETVVSDFQFKPQYLSLRISAEDIISFDVLNIEMREKNMTRFAFGFDHEPFYYNVEDVSDNATNRNFDFGAFDTSGGVDTSSVITVKSMGNIIYKVNRNLDDDFSMGGISALYGHVIMVAFQLVSKISLNALLDLFYSNKYLYYDGCDINLNYPTSIGLPFVLKLNMTRGRHQNEQYFPAFLSKKVEAIMLIDATYTNIGAKMTAACARLPNFNITTDRGVQFLFDLPREKNPLIDFEFGIYNIENNKLTPRMSLNESLLQSMCVPLLRNLTGSTICVEYCPKSKWWPIYNLKYTLLYQRDDNIRGINISFYDSKYLDEFSWEVLGAPDQNWKMTVHKLAQFENIMLQTPFFSMNGSGIVNRDVLYLDTPGLAMNITGMLSCMNDTAPFTLTAHNTMLNDSKADKLDVYFYSSIIEAKILSSYELKDGFSFDLMLPYRIKNKSPETARLTVRCVESNMVEDISENTDTTYDYFSADKEPTNVTMNDCKASVVFSQYPKTVVAGVSKCKSSDSNSTGEVESSMEFEAGLEISCDDHKMISTFTAVCNSDVTSYNGDVKLECPGRNVSLTESFHWARDHATMVGSLICNNETVYEMSGAYAIDPIMNVNSNATFLVPLRERDAKYPLLEMSFDQGFSLLKQQVHFVCKKTYRDYSLVLNMTAGAVLNDIGQLPGPTQTIQHHATVSLTCNARDPFMVSAQSELSSSLEALDLAVAVHLPSERWNKEAFKFKLKKTGQSIKTSVTENRTNKVADTYELEGTMDYNFLNNIV